MSTATRVAWLFAAAAVGCRTLPPAELPEPAPAPAPAAPSRCSDAAGHDPERGEEALPGIIVSSAAPPATCMLARGSRRAAPCPETRDDALLTIDLALTQLPDRRDALLADLEGCDAVPAPAVRALRAELAPRACRDVFAAPMLHADLEPDLARLFRALTIEGRLERVATGRPEVPFDGFAAYAAEKLEPWLEERRKLADELADAAPRSGPARHIARFAHGRALLALASAVRQAVLEIPACAPARFGRHGHVVVERCPVRLEGPGDASDRLVKRADALERRGRKLLRKALDDRDGVPDIDVIRAEEAMSLVGRPAEGAAGERNPATAPGPASGPAGVSTRLARRLPPNLVPILLPGARRDVRPPAAPASRAVICAGPGLARPHGGALIHAHQ